MPIINLKNFFSYGRFCRRKNTDTTVTEIASGDKVINQRMEEIYGRDQLALQLLYEQWVGKNDWKLKDEALLLLLAIDPELKSFPGNIDEKNIYDKLWIHARDCVEQGLLKVINLEQAPEEWCVKPVDVYRWAIISRIEVPAELGRLMEYIVSTVKQAVADKDGTDDYDKNRENILGMALAILAAFPERCKNGEGQVTADNILEMMDKKSHISPETRNTGLPVTDRRELIEKWLNTLKQ